MTKTQINTRREQSVRAARLQLIRRNKRHFLIHCSRSKRVIPRILRAMRHQPATRDIIRIMANRAAWRTLHRAAFRAITCSFEFSQACTVAANASKEFSKIKNHD